MSAARRVAALAALVVVLAPAAAAAPAGVSAAQLALMPMPLVAYGSKVPALVLASDSGPESNAIAASNANQQVTGAALARLGRVGGYVLDYGGAPTGQQVFEAESEVNLYKTHAQAVAGLAFWRKDEIAQPPPASAGLSIKATYFAVTGLGSGAFGYGGKALVKGLAPFYGCDVYFVQGDVVGNTSISTMTASAVRPLTISAARALRARVAAVLAGRVGGPPVKLPVRSLTTAGPPPGGPNLAALALGPSDLGGGTVKQQAYQRNPEFSPISQYARTMSPGGPFAYVLEDVSYFSDSIQARWVLTIYRNVFSSSAIWSSFVGSKFKSFHPSAVVVNEGDQSAAVLGIAKLKDGRTFYLSFVGVRKGKMLITVIAATPVGTRLLPGGVKSLAKIAADHATNHAAAEGGLTA